NEGARNHWLGVSLAGARANRSGLGARITLTDGNGRQQTIEATSAGSYLSSSDPRVIFGLGSAASVKSVEVHWPEGRTQKIANPNIDRYLTINERDAAAKEERR